MILVRHLTLKFENNLVSAAVFQASFPVFCVSSEFNTIRDDFNRFLTWTPRMLLNITINYVVASVVYVNGLLL